MTNVWVMNWKKIHTFPEENDTAVDQWVIEEINKQNKSFWRSENKNKNINPSLIPRCSKSSFERPIDFIFCIKDVLFQRENMVFAFLLVIYFTEHNGLVGTA